MSITDLAKPEFWQQLLSSVFNRGYIAGLGLVIALLVFLFIIKIIVKIVFRTHRCSSIPVPCADGDLIISRDAVENAARQVLATFPQLSVRRIQLYCRGKNYSMTLFTTFAQDEKGGLPELADKVKPKMTETLRRVFGIDSMKTIRFQVEELGKGDLEKAAADTVTVKEPARPMEKSDGNASASARF